ncbi:MAG TPA: DNA mismatch repair protein MutS [Vicinamibacterales bacterium]|nr:DNA mismatch repair protein MutS [Vicinamibacterales bacterium]
MTSPSMTPTPAMRQYFDAKRQHRDAIVFFRMGDFYEMFYEDALVASRALDLTLTSRSKDAGGAAIPMCGVPYHAVDGYLARLVKKGFRVAICEQVEDPKKAKGLVRREVVRVVSPGTLTDATYLEAREPAFLMSIAASGLTPASGNGEAADGVVPSAAPPNARRRPREQGRLAIGAALIDLSTGEFTAAEYEGAAGLQSLSDEIAILRPREIVVPSGSGIVERLPEVGRLQPPVTPCDPWTFEPDAARRTLLEQFRTRGLEAFGLEARPLAAQAAGALVSYLRDTQKADLAHVRAIGLRVVSDALIIDPITLRHLEVLQGAEGGSSGSLLDEIDRTTTAMGGRLLRAWLVRPLAALEPVRDRLDAVEELVFRSTDRGRFRECLKSVQDLERLVARAALGTAGPRDLGALGRSCAAIPRIREVLEGVATPLLRSLLAELDDLPDIRDRIARTLVDEPPVHSREGGFTRDGVDAELDELRGISRSGRQVIAEMEERERARTGIGSLKVRFNRVFGYYIEISRSNLHAVPPDYQRKQTIAGGERFTTTALKEYEEKVLGADERILERELQIFESLRTYVATEATRIQDTARALATLDVLAALAETAAVANYTKPHVHDGDELVVTEARHPVVERHVRDAFVPNDIDLNAADRQLVIVTGPNMGGKSTYLRQTALIPLLAQIGSFVPARQARVPIVDRIFARVGASDNIARGQSTFMVEMQETANILHTATSRSLVVLDEIGRGTSTFDGLSIAWAVAEYLAGNTRARPKTLFATHYHELTDLADAMPGVVNAHVAAREWKDDIVFLRKILPGRSDRSYGIQVARLAGLPDAVVGRAKEILTGLERDELSRGGRPTLSGVQGDPDTRQLGLFALPGPVAGARMKRDAEADILKRLQDVDVNETSPREAWDLIAELKRRAEEL